MKPLRRKLSRDRERYHDASCTDVEHALLRATPRLISALGGLLDTWV